MDLRTRENRSCDLEQVIILLALVYRSEGHKPPFSGLEMTFMRGLGGYLVSSFPVGGRVILGFLSCSS